MKKRFKLLTTIASLCLALAMVVFGVYAATSVQISALNYVYFLCEDVFVDIQIEYFQGPADGLFSGTTYRTANYTGKTYSASAPYTPTNATIAGLTDQSVAYTSSAPSAGIRITLTIVKGLGAVEQEAYFTIKTLPPTTGGSDKLVDSSNSTVSLKVDGEDYTTANTAVELEADYNSGFHGEDPYWETYPVVITYQRTLTKFATTFSSETCWSSVIKLANTAAGAAA